MATRQERKKDGAVYFGTFTCYRWLPLVEMAQAHDAVYRWMHIAHALGFHFFGYAIMPNHVHVVIRVPIGGAVNVMLANGKRFIAYAIIRRLKEAAHYDLLRQLQEGLRTSDGERRQKHRVFEASSDLVELFNAKMIEQKLKYIHANPVSKKWKLTEDAVQYPHSSFAFYASGDDHGAPLTSYHQFGYLGGKGAPW